MSNHKDTTTQPRGSKRKKPSRVGFTDRYVDIPALMERWGCSYDFVWSRLRRGEIEGMKLGRDWRISPESVARAEAAMASKSAA